MKKFLIIMFVLALVVFWLKDRYWQEEVPQYGEQTVATRQPRPPAPAPTRASVRSAHLALYSLRRQDD